MKHKLLLALLLSCSFHLCYGQIDFVSEQNGTITVNTEGTAKKPADAISDAEKYVFAVVFYRGIPGSTLKTGLIDIPEAEAERKYRDYFEAFYAGRYASFITTASQTGNIIKGKRRQKTVPLNITVNINALRKDLEENHIIRKFGY